MNPVLIGIGLVSLALGAVLPGAEKEVSPQEKKLTPRKKASKKGATVKSESSDDNAKPQSPDNSDPANSGGRSDPGDLE